MTEIILFRAAMKGSVEAGREDQEFMLRLANANVVKSDTTENGNAAPDLAVVAAHCAFAWMAEQQPELVGNE